MTDSVLSSNISSQTISVNEDTNDNSSQEREELEWKFKIMKKYNPDIIVPKFNNNSDIEIMRKTYENIKNNLTKPEELSYKKILSLRTLLLDFELQSTGDSYVYLAGTFDRDNLPYECIRYKYPYIPRYKKKKSLFCCLLTRSCDLIYGLYIPVQVTMMRLSQIDEKREQEPTILYEGKTLQNENGYVFFDNPIYMSLTLFNNIFLEYSIDEKRHNYEDSAVLNTLFHPVFLVGNIKQKTRILPLSDTKIPILKDKGIFFMKDTDTDPRAYKLIKE